MPVDSDSSTWAQRLFDEVVDLPRPQRRRYLAQHCDDPHTLAEVESLLAAFDDAGEFLADGEARPHDVDPHGVGSRIGAYELLELLGEGGFARVFRARQSHPVRREVAVKIIKLGMDTRAVLARFELERQALAVMDHPNVAAVYDAGVTDTGRPYFVMELVRGRRITQYCDEQRLDLRRRCRLFVDVCQGVQHAHQKGILHRDLKPSNVLVMTTDADTRDLGGAASVPLVLPKIIDFGIAKAIEPGVAGDATMVTQETQVLGTPQYMSPEQARSGGGAEVDTRSDVYSLGAMLYELLAGVPPIEVPTPSTAAPGGLSRFRKQLEEQEIRRPSTRIGAVAADNAEAILQSRRASRAELKRSLRGELDWIVCRCLEKDRASRYESASALAADLRAYLDRRPIAAAQPSAVYRTKKFVRRNAPLVAAATIVLLTLIVGAVVSTVMAVRASRAERVAQQRFDELRNVALTFMFDIDQKLASVPGTLPARTSVLDAAGRYLDELAGHANQDEVLLAQLAEAHQRLGATLDTIGDRSGAARAYDKSLSIFRALHEAEPDDLPRLIEFADVIAARSSTVRDLGQTPQQVESLRQGIVVLESALADSHFRADAAQADIRCELIKLYGNLGTSLRILGKYDDALAALQRAVTNVQAMPPASRDSQIVRIHHAVTLQKIGDLYEIKGDLDKALASHQAALPLSLAYAAENGVAADRDGNLARNYARLGHIAWRMNRFDEAVEYNRKQYEIRKRVADAEPASTVLQRDLARAQRQLGQALCGAGGASSSEPLQLMDDAIARLERLAHDRPDDVTLPQELAETYLARARVRPKDQAAEMRTDLTRSIDVNRHVLSMTPNDATARIQIKDAENLLGHPPAATTDPAAAN